MIVLAIHTTGPACDVSILNENVEMARATIEMRTGHDMHLPKLVEQALREAGLVITELNRIAVSVGPASFTGVRVGTAFARGLSIALNIEAVGLTSLHACLPKLLEKDTALVALPAKTRPPHLSWWAQTFRNGRPSMEADELDERALLQLAREVDNIAGLSLPDGMEGIIVEHSAQRLGEIALDIQNIEDYPPTPVYVREPDAVPMKRA